MFFSLMIAGLVGSLPHTLTGALRQQGVPAHVAGQVGSPPPVSSLFAAQLGANPIQHLLQPTGALTHLSAAQQQALTGSEVFLSLIDGPLPLRPGHRVRLRRGSRAARRDRLRSARQQPRRQGPVPHETPTVDPLARPRR
ncbi:hypothetical protein [Streptomyces sp. NPDC088115]|uniref:hypothetical protein n=1 Tax=Streptomyces sp. NPDC088115 TaxID=3365824 RepID=UPI00381A8C3C